MRDYWNLLPTEAVLLTHSLYSQLFMRLGCLRFPHFVLMFFLAWGSSHGNLWAQTPTPTTVKPDSLNRKKQPPKQPIKFTADSLHIVFDDKKGDIARLSKNTNVIYDQVKVASPLIRFYFRDQLVEAISITPNPENFPQFTRGSETFSSERLSFNLKTEQGRFVNSRTKMQDGFVLGQVVKVRSDSTVFVQHGLYTTCDNPTHVHYSLEAKKMKIGRNKWIYTGPIRLNLLNIKLPIILPFGAIPTIEGRRSGPLTPTYGQDNQQGFYLKDWGWYWPINDYMDAQIRFGIWSLGSFQVRPTYRYARRNRFSGSVDLTYRYVVTGQRYDADRNPRSTWDLGLNHAQKIDPYSDISANIRVGNSRLLRVLSENFNDRILSESNQNSNFSYNKRWTHKGRSVSFYGSLSDNLTTRSATLTLPALRFSQRSQTPFQRNSATSTQNARVYENLQYDLDADLNTNYSFRPVDGDVTDNRWWDGLFNPEAYRNTTSLDPAQRYYVTGTGNFRVSMPYTMRKTPIKGKNMELTMSPNLSLREYVVSREEGRLRIWGNTDPTTGVRAYRDSTFYRSSMVFFHDLNLSFSAGTTVYGTFPWKIGSLNGFRHVMRPSLSFSTRPTYEHSPWNYFRNLTDNDGKTVYDAQNQPIRYAVNSSIPTGKSRTLGFSVENVLRTRTIKTDSTGTVRKNAFDLLNFGFSSGYNFAADSLQWQDISMRGYTNIAGRLNLNFGGTLSPYKGLTSWSTSFSTSLRSRQNTTGAGQKSDKKKTELISDWTNYQIPWTLGLNFSYGYTAGFTASIKSQHRAILDASFNFQLTEKWRLEGRSGFDLVSASVTSTDLSVYRDLHCWEMAFSVRPFGKYQSFQFRLNVKSGKLRSILRLEHPKSDIRSSLTDIIR